ncbi:hypothetical protein CBS101457_005597 [Exobasidium rhododendri]|nr:hypothetical protein CBS101457_005597 [Exobasidium rhododendri]
MRWEKRVAEGLDRVFREWFSTGKDEGGNISGSSWGAGQASNALHRASLIASMGRGYSSSLPATVDSSMGKSREEATNLSQEEGSKEEAGEEEAEASTALPEAKMLEFDGLSCTLEIQPHPIDSTSFPSHPALTSMSSDHYLSNSSLRSHYHDSFVSRVEFTFHCESIIINAARLLSVLEMVEMDIERASELAKRKGGQIVAGSSGGTTWAYSTGGSSYATTSAKYDTSTRWSSDGPGGVSVLVFGASRQ